MPEAGDPLHDAFLVHLQTVATVIGLPPPWRVVDTENTGIVPDAKDPYVDFEIISGGERQAGFGQPRRQNLESGQITINFNMPLGRYRQAAGRFAWAMLEQLRADYSTLDAAGRTVTLFEPTRMGGGEKRGGLWTESMATGYEIYHFRLD